ncbi:DUF2797 domain-containing protein [Nocardia pseudobrasiliensis]|uniref:Uncharacterized protein DUF2797 n=1 Tax=Nocardia pseudobrasiliensis TaxID=45979 RepID=A0A370IDP5_9NOCA|nr:DUF2797 domain-containing protein [Nocardia pseudobrasiliensis]RDI68846.1 uncharacterized protein DUF2797 [Nocardia pseudobrasiliensis]
MTSPRPSWTVTGVYWRSNQPVLAAVDPRGADRERPLCLGDPLALRIAGPRRCVGIRQPGNHRACPFAAEIAPRATAAQCSACAAADPGHRLARDQLADDGRVYALYLTWLGPGMAKVGLTAAARGSGRLAEQGALTFTWITRGPLPAIRAMEQAISRTGLAAERWHRRAKVHAWSHRTGPEDRQRALRIVYEQIAATVPWPDGLPHEPYQPVDQAELFGFDRLPTRLREVAALQRDSVLAGTVRGLVGRELVLDTDTEPVLLDTRLLAGWPLLSSTASTTANLSLISLDLSGSDDADQTALF